MTKLDEAVRQQILIELSTGRPQSEIAKKCGVSQMTVSRIFQDLKAMDKAGDKKASANLRKKIKQRTDELELELRREFLDSDEIVENAVEQAALDRVEVISRHKAEWNAHKPIIDGIVADSVREAELEAAQREAGTLEAKEQVGKVLLLKERANVAKSTAETIKTRQEAERKIYGLDLGGEGEDRPFKNMDESQLAKRLAETMRRLNAEGLLTEEEFEGILK